MRLDMTTDDVPERERFDRWNAAVFSALAVAVQPSPDAEEPFRGLFEPTGASFARTVVRRRLEECRAALLGNPARPVIDIAFALLFQMARSKPISPRARPKGVFALIRPNMSASTVSATNAFELPLRMEIDTESPHDQHERNILCENGQNPVSDQFGSSRRRPITQQSLQVLWSGWMAKGVYLLS